MIAKAVIANKKSRITKNIVKTKKKTYNEPIYIISHNTSSAPHFPNFPPHNTPPDINYLRNIYMNYLSKTNLE